MKLPEAGIALALALLTFFQFPGHTYLQQDSQIYVAILEHLHDPSLLANDPLAAKPHVAYTLYDEAARSLRAVTGLGFREILEGEQIAARALGIWGLYLIALALGLTAGEGWLLAAIVSLGAFIAGPEVLTVEYEPTPRALALPLVWCAIGLAGSRRWMAAGIAGGAAFLLHPPTALAFWAVFLPLAAWTLRDRRVAGPAGIFVAAAVTVWLAARAQAGGGEGQAFFAHLTPGQELLQLLRASYNWISTWRPALIAAWLAAFALAMAAYARVRGKAPPNCRRSWWDCRCWACSACRPPGCCSKGPNGR